MYCHLKSYSVPQNHETSWNHNILFSFSLSVSFCMFACSKGHFIRAYLDTIQMTLICSRTFVSFLAGLWLKSSVLCILHLCQSWTIAIIKNSELEMTNQLNLTFLYTFFQLQFFEKKRINCFSLFQNHVLIFKMGFRMSFHF